MTLSEEMGSGSFFLAQNKKKAERRRTISVSLFVRGATFKRNGSGFVGADILSFFNVI
jgi:hypothetical protein